jgi:EmrB/QacA subfamily drug resistance transporter
VFSTYLLTQAVSTPIYGRLADIHGRKRVFFAGSAVFLLGSTACGFTWSMASLVVFRTMQGLGAGCIQSVATTIVGDIYAPSDRARVQGWLSGVWALAALIGPILGAFIVAQLHWAYVFWINVPIGIVAIALLAFFLQENLKPREHQIDYLGAALLMIGLAALITAMVQQQSLDLGETGLLLAIGIVALTGLAFQERRAKEPIIPLDLLRNRIIAAGNAGSLMIGALLMCVIGLLPTYVEALMGRTAAVAGTLIAVLSIVWSCGSIVAGRLMPKTTYRNTGVFGALALIAGSVLLIMLDPHSSLSYLTVASALIGLGMGVTNIVFLIAVQSSVGWSERGIATASTLFSRTIGQTLGAGLSGAILNFGVARRTPEFADALDRVLQPSGNDNFEQLDRLIAAVAAGLHEVYIATALLALATLAIALLLPAGWSPGQMATGTAKPPGTPGGSAS